RGPSRYTPIVFDFIRVNSLDPCHPRSIDCGRLHQQFFNHIPVHVSQSEVTSLKAISQFRVIESEQMQDSRVQIVDVRGVFGHVESEFVSLAKWGAGLDAAAREPHRESLVVMIAA